MMQRTRGRSSPSIRTAIRAPRRFCRQNRRVVQKAPASVREAWLKKTQWLAAVTITLGAIVGAFGGGYYGWRALRHAQRMSLKHIDVSGNSRARSDELIAYTNVKLGDSILDVDLDEIALRLRHHPWVFDAVVGRSFPDRLTIQVVENKPAILVALGEVYLADAEGRLFKLLTPSDRLDLPVITGLDRDETGRRPEATAERVRQGLKLWAAMGEKASCLGELSELHWDNHLGWSAVLSHDSSAKDPGLRVILGLTPERRLAAAAAALALVKSRGLAPSVLWADSAERPGQIPMKLTNAPSAHGSATFVATAR
jgi:cell division septal protein FtsQ